MSSPIGYARSSAVLMSLTYPFPKRSPDRALGLLLMYQTISLFANVGEGTLAPWDPPRNFVVRGVYRYVRNPMISGVLFILLGEATLLGSLPLLAWFLVFFAVNATYIPLLEERQLARRFGGEYLT